MMSNREQESKFPFTLSDSSLLQTDSYIDGKTTTAHSRARFPVIDPGTGQSWITCPDNSAEDVDAAVQSAHSAFQAYRTLPPRRRAQLLLAWHNLIVAARSDLAIILVHETGKPLAEALAELDYATSFTWWFTGEAERIHGSVFSAALPGRRTLTIKQPIGVAAALVPWNFPVALLLRKASAALAAGCTMVVKPSPETPVTAACLAYLATKAGFAPGVLNVVTTSLENTPAVAEALCLHDLVKKVTFTGSTRVGRIVSGLCASKLKKVTLELGGNCPFIVFDDANLDQVIGQLMTLKWRHAGQACITANRVYVQNGIYDAFCKAILEKSEALKMGHGMGEGITLGPVTTPRSLDKAEDMGRDAVKRGAKTLLGEARRRDKDGGYFMSPTIFINVTDEMNMSREEIFAPILGISTFETEEEVLKRANNTSMGLASYVFSKNVDRLWRMFENLEAGMIGLNTGNSSASEAPFGGIKESGLGKESGREVAVDEYLITKTGTMTLEGHF